MYLEIDEGYPGHRKTLRLCALLKCETADAYPPRMWAWAARSAPDGDLTGMDAVELELALRWRGAEGTLYAALVKAGFLDEGPNGGIAIHNWPERTGGAIQKMAVRAGMAKERRAHMERKCIAACRYCAGTLTLRSPARSSQDKTSQDQSSDLPPSLPLEASDARSEERAEVDPLRRDRDYDVPLTAGELTALFSRLWERRWSARWIGASLAARPARLFMDGFPPALAEKTAAAREIKPAIGRYLASPNPFYIQRKHPFDVFVKDYDALRFDSPQRSGDVVGYREIA